MITVTVDTVTAARLHPGSITLVFASHKRPGGGWKQHEQGQEEYIARRSDLVMRLQPYINRYGNNAAPFYIILHQVSLGKEKRDMIVAPACVAPLYHDPKKEMEQRIQVVCHRIAAWPIFITGPWGCGFFGNDKEHVKACFEEHATNRLVFWVEYN